MMFVDVDVVAHDNVDDHADVHVHDDAKTQL